MSVPRFIQAGVDTGQTLLTKMNGALHFYNVEMYGAKHDTILDANGYIVSGTDDTVAIQNAILDCSNNGSGIVFCPAGIYRISGVLQTAIDSQNPNCQIYFPSNNNSGYAKTIKILGECPPPYFASVLAGCPVHNNGTIFYSDIQGTGTFPSVFGGKNGLISFGKYFINCSMSFENITVRVLANKTTTGVNMCGINGQNYSNIQCKNVRVESDTTPYDTIEPTVECFGIHGFDTDGNSFNEFTDCMVTGGFKYAYVFGELSHGYNCHSYGNHTAFVMTAMNHASCFDKLVAAGNKNVFVGNITGLNPGVCHFKVNLAMIEISTYSGRWYGISHNTVNDPSNVLYGNISYACVGNGGFNQAIFVKTGGSHLTCTALE